MNNIDQNRKLNWWLLFEISARKIQKQFRKWYYKRKYSIKDCIISSDKLLNTIKYPNFSETFQKIISEDGSHEDKMSFWRGMIELRRNHKTSSSDIMIRALIDSNGDLSRSIVLLGTKAFLENNTNNIPNKLRIIFIPQIELSKKHIINQNNNLKSLNNVEYIATNKVNDIRYLKDQQKRYMKRKELFDILNSVIKKIYFSNIHCGHKDFKKLQKLPSIQKSSKQSKISILKQNDLIATINI